MKNEYGVWFYNIHGKIRSTVNSYELPTENGQANFKIKGSKYAKYEDDI